MENVLRELLRTRKNFVFIGEAGSGKSEIAINMAIYMKQITNRPVHFFDMDQTKPLCRSRDAKKIIEDAGVCFHYEEQFYDAPTLVGGVNALLADEEAIVILDVGGNHQGARLIGGFAGWINRENTISFFVVNPYRPWSRDVMAIDGTLSEILKVSHIQKFHVISNPNLGPDTTPEEVLEGNKNVKDMIGEYIDIDYLCTLKENVPFVKEKVDVPLIPIELFIKGPWV